VLPRPARVYGVQVGCLQGCKPRLANQKTALRVGATRGVQYNRPATSAEDAVLSGDVKCIVDYFTNCFN
jgi:hypothetical protein